MAQAHIATRCAGPWGRAEAKKKARRMVDAPSNRTFGNCLLGFHCSQKDPVRTRANACFWAVAECQQAFSYTGYQQVDLVLTQEFRGDHLQGQPASKRGIGQPDFRRLSVESRLRSKMSGRLLTFCCLTAGAACWWHRPSISPSGKTRCPTRLLNRRSGAGSAGPGVSGWVGSRRS